MSTFVLRGCGTTTTTVVQERGGLAEKMSTVTLTRQVQDVDNGIDDLMEIVKKLVVPHSQGADLDELKALVWDYYSTAKKFTETMLGKIESIMNKKYDSAKVFKKDLNALTVVYGQNKDAIDDKLELFRKKTANMCTLDPEGIEIQMEKIQKKYENWISSLDKAILAVGYTATVILTVGLSVTDATQKVPLVGEVGKAAMVNGLEWVSKYAGSEYEKHLNVKRAEKVEHECKELERNKKWNAMFDIIEDCDKNWRNAEGKIQSYTDTTWNEEERKNLEELKRHTTEVEKSLKKLRDSSKKMYLCCKRIKIEPKPEPSSCITM